MSVGGAASYTGNIFIERVIFENNISGAFVGALNLSSDGGFVYVLGNLFHKNRCLANFCAAQTVVNALSQATARAFWANNTFIDNRCSDGAPASCTTGGVRIAGSARTNFFNNVFAPGTITGRNIDIIGAPVDVNFNNIYSIGGTAPQSFSSNISAVDPGFLDAAANNFRLSPASPLRNAGGFIEGNAAVDLDGNPRVDASVIDMGAYEFQSGEFRNGFE